MSGYNKNYFKGHFIRDRMWEIEIGKNIVNTLNIKSMIDFRCGIGGYLTGAYEAKCIDIMGVDLYKNMTLGYMPKHISDIIISQDITQCINIKDKLFDCSLSIEVGEHLPPKSVEIFINNLTLYCKKYIIMTAAPPGQRGTGHINLKEKSFWINLIKNKGFLHNDKLVKNFKNTWENIVIQNTKYSTIPPFIYENLMVFKRKK